MKDYIKNITDAERRFLAEPVSFETREGGAVDENVIEGYAAVFNKDSEDFGGWYERIAPGAFSEVLGDDVVALFNHDMNLVLGRSGVNVTLKEDTVGLKYRVSLPDTTLGKDLRTLIKDKIINKSSFAFWVKEQRWVHTEGKPSVRTLVKMKRLFDVSPVTTPAYPDATVGARSFAEEKKTADPVEVPLTADLINFKLIINKHV